MPWDIRKHATDVAYKAVSSSEGAGVFAVELFLTGDGQVVFLLLSLKLLNAYIHIYIYIYIYRYTYILIPLDATIASFFVILYIFS